jgi:hypothetical protein
VGAGDTDVVVAALDDGCESVAGGTEPGSVHGRVVVAPGSDVGGATVDRVDEDGSVADGGETFEVPGGSVAFPGDDVMLGVDPVGDAGPVFPKEELEDDMDPLVVELELLELETSNCARAA